MAHKHFKFDWSQANESEVWTIKQSFLVQSFANLFLHKQTDLSKKGAMPEVHTHLLSAVWCMYVAALFSLIPLNFLGLEDLSDNIQSCDDLIIKLYSILPNAESMTQLTLYYSHEPCNFWQVQPQTTNQLIWKHSGTLKNDIGIVPSKAKTNTFVM